MSPIPTEAMASGTGGDRSTDGDQRKKLEEQKRKQEKEKKKRPEKDDSSDDEEARKEEDEHHTDLLKGLFRVLNVTSSIKQSIVTRLSCVGYDVDKINLEPAQSEDINEYTVEGFSKRFSKDEVNNLKARRKLLMSTLSSGGRGHFAKSWADPAFIQKLSLNRVKDYQIAGVHWMHAIHDTYIDRKTKNTVPCPRTFQCGGNNAMPEEAQWPPENCSGINGILADEMGLGKTAQTILFLLSLYHTGRLTKPTIVCCPASLMDNWVNELALWAPTLRTMKWHGNRNEKLLLVSEWQEAYTKHQTNEIHFFNDEQVLGYDDDEVMPEEDLTLLDEDSQWIKENCHYLAKKKQPELFKKMSEMEWMGRNLIGYDVLVTSHDAVRSQWDKSMFFKRFEFDYMVVDEAHALKNSSSQTYKAMLSTVKAERRLLLTGSPVQNALNELLTLVAFLVPDALFPKENWEPAMALLLNMQKNQQAILQAEKKKDASKLKDLKNQFRIAIPKKVLELCTATPSSDEPALSEPDPCVNSFDPAIVSMQPNYGEESPVEPRKGNEDFDSLFGALKGKREAQGKNHRWDVTFLQSVLTPIILRRLKDETITELPPKTNEIRPCIMTERQSSAYHNEVKMARSSMGKTLQKLDSMRTGKRAKISPKKDAENQKPEEKQKPDFVKNLVARLRRICNHSLLNVGRHSQETYDFAMNYWITEYSGKESDDKQALEWVQKFSDFDWHQFATDILHEMGDTKMPDGLKPLLLANEAFADSGKIVTFLEELDRLGLEGRKCLAFSQYVQYLDIVQEALIKLRPDVKFLRIDGQVNAKLRQDLVDQFNNDPDIQVILLSTRAAGQGYNLTSADTVILLDQDWNPQIDRQAEDRVHRLGQTKPVTVMRFYCEGTVEERILHTCQNKLNLDDAFGGNSELLSAALLEDAIKAVELQTEAEQIEAAKKDNTPPTRRRKRELNDSETPDGADGDNRKRAASGGASGGQLKKRKVKVRVRKRSTPTPGKDDVSEATPEVDPSP